MTIKILKSAIFSVALVLLVSNEAALCEEVLAVTEPLGNLQFINDQGEADGFAVQVARALAKRAGRELSISIFPWARSMKMAREQKNIMIFSISRIPWRERQFQWVGGICNLPLYVWGTQDAPVSRVATFADLMDYVFAVSKSSLLEEYLRSEGVTNIMPVLDPNQVFAMLLHQRADFTISGYNLFKSKVINQGLNPAKFRRIHKLEQLHSNLHIAFGPYTDEQLLAEFKTAYVEVKDEGIIAKLQQAWAIDCDP